MIYLKKIFIFLLIILFYILLIETILRSIIYLNSGNSHIFFYGLNKNISFEIADLSELKFSVNNSKNFEKFKITNNSIKKDNIVIWTFGASLTYGYSCGENSSSWPNELSIYNKNLKIENFGFPAKYSEDSIKILKFNLQNSKLNRPDIIIWAHRDEEKLSIFKGIKRNDDKIENDFSISNIKPYQHFLMRLKKTSELNFTFFVILNHAFEKLNLVNKRNLNKPNEEDFVKAIKNFELNTLDAINFSNKYDVNNFVILSLVSEEDINKDYSVFLNEYFKISRELANSPNVHFLNIIDHLSDKQIQNSESFFCKNMHFTLVGNKAISNIVNKFIIELK